LDGKDRSLIGIGWGFGTAVGLALLVAGFIWYSHRPRPEKPWNESAIKATYTDASFSIQSDQALGDFRYSLQNTTDRDYRLPADAKVMMRLSKDMSYRDVSKMAWDHALYIPAGQKVNVSIKLPIMYSDFNFTKAMADDEKQLVPFMDRRMSEIDGFALFDLTNRYKVDFPSGWAEAIKRAKEREDCHGSWNQGRRPSAAVLRFAV
jgi:hypothetical protein